MFAEHWAVFGLVASQPANKLVPMRTRFSNLQIAVIAVSAVLSAALVAPASAQEAGQWVRPPKNLSHSAHPDQAYNLDTLFDALKIAPDDTSAKAIEERIWSVWMVSGSDTCNLLMSRVKAAADDKDYDLAIKLLNAIIIIKPDYVEAWNQRATIFYLKNDYGHALADISEVLAREPRHFGALSGLGLILQDIGDDKHALEAYRKALAIDPHLEHLPDVVKTLSEKVEGRDI
jgi:tetratricopeptide (TPR) repeat protein